jgi:hypothetical protein
LRQAFRSACAFSATDRRPIGALTYKSIASIIVTKLDARRLEGAP